MKKEMTAEKYLKRIMIEEVKENCLVRRTLELLSGKWRTHIIYELCKHESMRFGELKKAYPHITNTMLTNTLKDLVNLGIVHREQMKVERKQISRAQKEERQQQLYELKRQKRKEKHKRG